MQRIEPDDRRALCRRGLGEPRQRSKIADALIAGAAQRVQMRGDAETALARRQMAALGHYGEMADGVRTIVQQQPMAAYRERRQRSRGGNRIAVDAAVLA